MVYICYTHFSNLHDRCSNTGSLYFCLTLHNLKNGKIELSFFLYNFITSKSLYTSKNYQTPQYSFTVAAQMGHFKKPQLGNYNKKQRQKKVIVSLDLK